MWKDLRAIWKFGFTKNNVTLFKDGQNIFEENLDDNLLISLKGDSDYLENIIWKHLADICDNRNRLKY